MDSHQLQITYRLNFPQLLFQMSIFLLVDVYPGEAIINFVSDITKKSILPKEGVYIAPLQR